VSIYPQEVWERCEKARHRGRVAGENACATDASFVCGCYVRFSLRIDPESKVVGEALFETNGCGFMIATADWLAEAITGKHLTELNGFDRDDLEQTAGRVFGTIDDGRFHCVDCCISALTNAFADHRTRQIEEFQGEKALICTCFGVSEDAIESHIIAKSLNTVEQVGDKCNAGTGCGSCRMLIQEIIDNIKADG